MKTSIYIHHIWIGVFLVNNVAIVLGLYLPINFPCLNFHLRKVSIVAFFLIICSSFISLIDIQHQNVNVTFKQINLMFYTVCCSIVVVNRYRYCSYKKRILQTLFCINEFPANVRLLTRENLKDFLKNNAKLLFMIVLFICIIVCTVYLKNVINYHICHDSVLFIMLTVEMFFVIQLMEIIKYLSRMLTEKLRSLYKNFHKVPPAELKKSQNRDLVLIGWISEAIDFDRKKEAVEEIQTVSKLYYNLGNCIEEFNISFGGSILAVIVIFLLKFIALTFWIILNDPIENFDALLVNIFETSYILVCMYLSKYIFFKKQLFYFSYVWMRLC